MKLAAALLLLLATTVAAEEKKVVLLPFENASGAPEAAAEIRALVQSALEQRRWRIADAIIVEEFLQKHRVRHLDSIESALRRELLDATGTVAVVHGRIHAYRSTPTPAVALSMRAVDREGRTLWADVTGLTADDSEGLLGLGRKNDVAGLAREAVKRALSNFRCHAVRPRRARHRIVVLPFDNGSNVADASRVFADIFASRMARSRRFEIVEPADVRAAAGKLRIRSFRNAEPALLQELAKQFGTSRFITGTVYRWRNSTGRNGNSPELHVDLTLIDVAAQNVLWATTHTRRGEEYEGLLLRGAVTEPVSLVDRVVAEVVAAAERRVPSKGEGK